MRYLLELAYKGTKYHGWQIQPNSNTVQAEVNKALSIILQANITTLGSGRTDAGVHAKQQYIHFDYHKELDAALIGKLNSVSPSDIAFYSIQKVDDNFNVRFDAVSRSYCYYIETTKNPFQTDLYYRFHQLLDINKMNEAAKLLLTHTDFECFSKVHTDVNTFNCTISLAEWRKVENKLEFRIQANRFLRGMVRAIVGTLLEVGQGKMKISEFQQVLKSNDRGKAGRSVPASGLFLTEVKYDL